MQRRDFLAASAVATGATLLPRPALAAPLEVTVTVQPKREIGRTGPYLYGHFLEHLENVIYGGIFEEGSPRANPAGIRLDVVAAIKEMGGAGILRWPGGNFASGYHWRDGIGPRDERPRRLDLAFGAYDSNRFGTDEYLELCRLTGAEPFITVNMGSGTVEEACRWVEYCRREGRQPPVRIWGLGNENWGPWQMGYYTPEQYSQLVQQYAQFMRVVEPDLRFVGVGHTEGDWNQKVLASVGDRFDWLSIHLYGHRTFLGGQDDFDSTLITPVRFEREIGAMVDQIDTWEAQSRRSTPLEITLEEWNTRHIRPGGKLWRGSPRNIVDALFTACVFNVCQRQSRRVTMSNFVFLINTHAPIVVNGDRVLKTATFDVFRLYAQLSQAVVVPVNVSAPSFTATEENVPGWNAMSGGGEYSASRLDASATRSTDSRKTSVFLVNRDSNRPMRVRLDGLETDAPARLHLLAAESHTAVNTFDDPDRVRARTTLAHDWRSGILLPPASFGVLELG